MKDGNIKFSDLTPAQYAAINSLTLQLGLKGYTKGFDKSFQALKNGDFEEASRQLLINKSEKGKSELLNQTPDRTKEISEMLRTGRFQKDYGT